MPVVLSSLIVIPIVLIGYSLNRVEVGFIAALLSSIAWSYYNRTMVGYYDTDMLNIIFPTFLLWSLIWALWIKEDKYLLFIALDIIAYRWWYPQSYSLEFAFWGIVFLYIAYIYFKNEKDFTSITFHMKILSIMMIAMMGFSLEVRLVFVLLLFAIFKSGRADKYVVHILIVSVLLFIVGGGLSPIMGQLKSYVFRDATSVKCAEELELHFFTVAQTIREAGKISFETFANRISGHIVIFVLSIVGYIWLVFKHRIMFIGLPMIGLGFLAYIGGLRFTVYAVPVLALGIAFLIAEIANLIKNQVVKYSLMAILTILVLIPNINHIVNYKVPTVFTKQEVKVLDKLKKIATREDYVISWWDYGFPIRYYSDVKTLVDGGKHRGYVNFPVSFILTNDQLRAAKLARLDVEYTEKLNILRKNNDKKTKIASSNIAQMTLDYGYKDTNDFLNILKTDIKLPEKTRGIFIYLPNRMLNIFPTVALFSNLDLMTGKKKAAPFFYQSKRFKDSGNVINLGNGIKIIKNKGQIQIGRQVLPINNFAVTAYDNRGILRKQVQTINRTSPISVIYMKSYNTFLVLDKKMYDSLFIQLFVLENYDKNLFEPIILNPLAKVYKLKI
jgi:dolichyl-diphosphooligosaccharide--protein glycosyltransferase/undecaprenyl-diphosphooligosaccharide--protein glycosyltransferase